MPNTKVCPSSAVAKALHKIKQAQIALIECSQYLENEDERRSVLTLSTEIGERSLNVIDAVFKPD